MSAADYDVLLGRSVATVRGNAGFDRGFERKIGQRFKLQQLAPFVHRREQVGFFGRIEPKVLKEVLLGANVVGRRA